MKKRRKGKVRCLSVLLTGCLLLSIIPATAFAAEDTAPAKSENSAGEEIQMPEQQNATEETKMGAVTPAPKDETKATDNGVSGTSVESKNDKAEDLQPSEQSDAEKKSASVDTSNSVIENTSEDANTENKDEQIDKSNEKSSAEVATLALEQPKPDYLPQGVMYFSDGYKHAYHTRVDVTANVSVKDSTGTVVETTQVSKSSGEFNFITEGFPSAEVLQTAVENLQTEIETPYKARGTVTSENESAGPIIDHFESASLYTFTPTSGNPVDFSSDLEAAKQYFNEHPDATGTFTVILDVHEYQIYDYTYDLIVQENSQPASTITSAVVQNMKFNYQPSDAPQATAEVYNADADKYEIAYECWQQFKGNEPVAAWYSDNGAHGSLPTITEFESGEKYVYFLMLKPKDGYSFSSETAVTVNGWTVEQQNISVNLDGQSVYVTGIATIRPTKPVEPKEIEVIEINNATITFKDGDKPVFTGNVPDNEGYSFRCEWWSLDENTGIVSTEPEWGGDIYKNKITAFEAGKTYHYGVYVTAYTADISPDAKLKINGREVNYTRIGDDGDTQSFWVETELTMMPQAGGTTPAEKYTVTYTDGVDNEEVFKDQTYTVEAGKATPAFNGTPTRKGYTFTGWKPAVAAIVTGNATYEATWKTGSATTTPKDDKSNTGETTSPKTGDTGNGKNSTTLAENKSVTVTTPKTGDTSNIVLWIVLLFVSSGALVGAVVIVKKKKYNR